MVDMLRFEHNADDSDAIRAAKSRVYNAEVELQHAEALAAQTLADYQQSLADAQRDLARLLADLG